MNKPRGEGPLYIYHPGEWKDEYKRERRKAQVDPEALRRALDDEGKWDYYNNYDNEYPIQEHSEKRLPPVPPPVYHNPRDQISPIDEFGLYGYGIEEAETVTNRRCTFSEAPRQVRSRSSQEPLLQQKDSWWSDVYGDDNDDEGFLDLDDRGVKYPGKFKLALILCCGLFPYLMVVLDDTVVITILPTLIKQFQKPLDIGWYASAYFLPLTVLMPLFGKVYIYWKAKWIFIACLALFCAGSSITATANSSMHFIFGRAVAGFGAAGITTGSMRIISFAVPRNQRPIVEGACAAALGASTMSGPIVGGAIATSIGWRWSFWINVPVVGSSILLSLFLFPKDSPSLTRLDLRFREKIKRIDLIGAALLSAGLVFLVYLLELFSTSGKFTFKEGLFSGLALVFLSLFVIHEYFVNAYIGLIPRKILAIKEVWISCIGLFFLFAGFINYTFFLSIFFQAIQGQNAQASALRLMPYVLAVITTVSITGMTITLSRYYNPYFMLGGVVMTIGGGFILHFNINTTTSTRVLFEAVLGAGVGLLMLGNVMPCQTVVQEEDHSSAQALAFSSSMAGATISIPISNTLFNKTFQTSVSALSSLTASQKALALANPTLAYFLVPPDHVKDIINCLTHSIKMAFVFGLCCLVVSAVFFWLIPWTPLFVKAPRHVTRLSIGMPMLLTVPKQNFYTTRQGERDHWMG